MKAFALGQRVSIRTVVPPHGETIALPLPCEGVVRRLRYSDRGAWVELDERHELPGVHPFPADDATRSAHVLTFPEFCDAVRAGGAA